MPGTAGKVWLITGCSSGFGRALSEQLLARGDRVLMTVRNRTGVADLLELYPSTAHAVVLDVTDTAHIHAPVREAEAHFGKIDILVNNAGYALLAGVEEATVEEYRNIFETNFFGALEVLRAVLPGMRARRNGHIITISSMAGISGGMGMAYYGATKFAITAVSESLALEAAHLNIKVTIVEPGAFRTDMRQNWRMGEPIADYAPTIGMIRQAMQSRSGVGTEPGNPILAAQAIITLADTPNPPLHLPLGSDAIARLDKKIATVTGDLEKWRDLALSTDDALQD